MVDLLGNVFISRVYELFGFLHIDCQNISQTRKLRLQRLDKKKKQFDQELKHTLTFEIY